MVRIVCHNRRTTSRDAQKGCPLRVWFVWFIWSIWFVLLLDPEKPNKPNKRDRPNNGLLTLADFFSILRGSQRVIEAEQEGSMLSHEERERL
jgi:hypothetical protein